MLPGRTTADAIKAIVEWDDSIPLEPFIEIANELVTECCTLQGQGYTDSRLEMIERWLSAHFYAIRDQRPQMESVGPIREGYQKVIDTFLGATQYGQQAMILDTKGGLAAHNNKPKFMRDLPIGITFLGTPTRRQINVAAREGETTL